MLRALGSSIRLGACLVVLACAVGSRALAQTTNPQAQISQPQPKYTVVDPAANRPPDANQIMWMHEQQAKRRKFDAANLERRRQLIEDTALLLKLAQELKREVARASVRGLSSAEMQKLEDIERLAHNVQLKMKLTVGAG
ncbi:hypothetical protein DYQ86_21660 [Acidobacteria bacterium AB60]|nr:hypothetical protein DYQ86_21660 [Acidobacteria bacterium AB60]